MTSVSLESLRGPTDKQHHKLRWWSTTKIHRQQLLQGPDSTCILISNRCKNTVHTVRRRKGKTCLRRPLNTSTTSSTVNRCSSNSRLLHRRRHSSSCLLRTTAMAYKISSCHRCPMSMSLATVISRMNLSGSRRIAFMHCQSLDRTFTSSSSSSTFHLTDNNSFMKGRQHRCGKVGSTR